MTQRDEQLSALLDDALTDQQLDYFMQDLKRDPIADGEAAQRYRLMGDVMRDEIDQSSFIDISGAVHRSIELEPAYTESVTKISQKSGTNLAVIFSSWVKPLTGMALAASVAMVTLLTFNSVQNSETAQPAQLAQSSTVQPVNPEIARNVQVASTLSIKTSEQQKQLAEYMMQHSGYARQATMQGMMPYVRAADVDDQEKN